MAGPLTDRTGSGAGHGHGHGHAGPAGAVKIGALARRLLLAALAVAAVATVVGVVVWWPDGDQVQRIADRAEFAAPGVSFPQADVRAVDDCGADAQPGCALLEVRVTEGAGSGDEADVQVPQQVVDGGLKAGDSVTLQRTPPAGGGDATYSFSATDRGFPLAVLALIFVVVVVAVARLRGVLALVGLAVASVVLAVFTLPALLSGQPGAGVALVTGAAIMFVVLYTTHGVSLRTSVALGGTLLGIGLTALVGELSVNGARLSGIGAESSGLLSAFASDLSFQGLLTCAVIVAGLGVLNDVTITQASSVWEVRAASPTMPRREVYRAGMRIGRDHIASTIYTIVFAYSGAALTTLLLLYLYDRPLLDLLSTEELASEVVRTLTTSIGLVLAVPVTTALAALVAGPRDPAAAGSGADHGAAPPGDAEEPDDDLPGSLWLRRAQRRPAGRRVRR